MHFDFIFRFIYVYKVGLHKHLFAAKNKCSNLDYIQHEINSNKVFSLVPQTGSRNRPPNKCFYHSALGK